MVFAYQADKHQEIPTIKKTSLKKTCHQKLFLNGNDHQGNETLIFFVYQGN